MNNLVVKPADRALGEVVALGNDVAADMKGLGQMVIQPVVDIVQPPPPSHKPTTSPQAANDKNNNDDAPSMDLFAKTAACIFSSVIMYAIADIRNLIRNHRDQMIGDPDRIQQLMTLPITDIDVMMIVMDNLSVLQQMMKKGEIDFYVNAVHRYRKELVSESQMALSQRNDEMSVLSALRTTTEEVPDEVLLSSPPPPPPPHGNDDRRTARRRSIFEAISPPQKERIPNTMEVFDDENSHKELVYAISINRQEKQIMISFRGSVSTKDWMMNGKLFLVDIPNPLWLLQQQYEKGGKGKEEDHRHHRHSLHGSKFSIPQSQRIGIHAGFYEYLFASRSKTDDTSKYRQIVKSLQALLDKEEALLSFSINVTGHSLGGALATLFSFHLVLETDWKWRHLPITCISFAAPKCGNIQFARAFQELELQNQMICLRVANHRDLVTERPDRLTCWTFCLQNAIFRHVGIELLLYPEQSGSTTKQRNKEDKRYRIRYQRVRHSRLSQFSDDFFASVLNTIHCTASVTCGCCVQNYLKWHSCDEYLNRVEQIENALESVPMQELFSRYHTVVAAESEIFTTPIGYLSRKISAHAP